MSCLAGGPAAGELTAESIIARFKRGWIDEVFPSELRGKTLAESDSWQRVAVGLSDCLQASYAGPIQQIALTNDSDAEANLNR